MKRLLPCLFILLSAAACSEPPGALTGLQRELFNSDGFLARHPDVGERKRAIWLLDQGRHEEALAAFRSAAHYGDKPSQAMLAEMYWQGSRVTQDRATAYAWMDLAAERGYALFVAKRERYWRALNPAERQRALEVGARIYEGFGDEVAMRRLQTVLDRGRFGVTGSRVGFVGALTVLDPRHGLRFTFDGEDYYDRRFWEIDRYREFTDAIWSGWPRGEVEVGGATVERCVSGGDCGQ
ncbi:hypothetical protein [Pseudomarimonas salicorniae]|uniref:Sel1 repeat-containing protein n=1 Tax=Pseudomarimonas salicorniae TaxID=2933270 RepID=A0ABT0GKI0_9GAMM|nr:hypothetical protein [Lysobacter sp. CAU 1642]MCK7594525.1 hypothetical protein [Lysobacter sp. CAU 1642]